MVENLNTPFVANKLQEIQPDLAVFTGGGIIRESILTKCGHGVINCHEGILPYYRGRSTIEWPILLNDFNNIGISTHLMTKNIDEGPILTTQRIPFIPNEKFSDYHHRLAPLMCEELVNSSVQLLNHKIIPQFQAKQEGKLFFKMGRYALELAQEKMCC
jgi:methionyl-tRNA formyltransferase